MKIKKMKEIFHWENQFDQIAVSNVTCLASILWSFHEKKSSYSSSLGRAGY